MPMNYRGDVTKSIEKRIESGIPMGPNAFAEMMWPTKAEYDHQADMTKVFFTLEPPAKYMEMINQAAGQQETGK